MSKTIISKRCSRCKQTKLLSEFHKHRCGKDGHRPDCKVCRLKHEKQYCQSKKGKITRKRYQQSKRGKAVNQKGIIRHFTHYPERRKARSVVTIAIRAGRLPRATTLLCHYCTSQARQYHHYLGYAPEHWLDIIPTCYKCHQKLQ